MFRSAAGDLSAPNANAFSSAARLWLRSYDSRSEAATNAVLATAAAVLELSDTFAVPPDQKQRHAAAVAHLVAAQDRLAELQPPARESAADLSAREKRRGVREAASWDAARVQLDQLDDDASDDALGQDTP